MTIWRHWGTDSTFGSGLRSSPQMRSSKARCSARIPVSSTPLSRRPQRNRAPGVSRLSSRATSSERDGPGPDHSIRDCLATASVPMSRAPASERRSPLPPTTTVAREGSSEAGGLFAGTRVIIGTGRHKMRMRGMKGPDVSRPRHVRIALSYRVFEMTGGLCAPRHIPCGGQYIGGGNAAAVAYLPRTAGYVVDFAFRPGARGGT